jgi:hypothetical protein
MFTSNQWKTLFSVAEKNAYLLILQWLISDEMRYCQYQTTIASRDLQSHISDLFVTNDGFTEVLSTK